MVLRWHVFRLLLNNSKTLFCKFSHFAFSFIWSQNKLFISNNKLWQKLSILKCFNYGSYKTDCLKVFLFFSFLYYCFSFINCWQKKKNEHSWRYGRIVFSQLVQTKVYMYALFKKRKKKERQERKKEMAKRNQNKIQIKINVRGVYFCLHRTSLYLGRNLYQEKGEWVTIFTERFQMPSPWNARSLQHLYFSCLRF